MKLERSLAPSRDLPRSFEEACGWRWPALWDDAVSARRGLTGRVLLKGWSLRFLLAPLVLASADWPIGPSSMLPMLLMETSLDLLLEI